MVFYKSKNARELLFIQKCAYCIETSYAYSARRLLGKYLNNSVGLFYNIGTKLNKTDFLNLVTQPRSCARMQDTPCFG